MRTQGKVIHSMNNERGGIISKLIFIPLGLALMAGFFFLGYYVGKYQTKSGASNELLPPLPDVASQHMPRLDEFTFYKSLTEKENRTVAIEVKPKPAEPERALIKKVPVTSVRQEKEKSPEKQERSIEFKLEKPSPRQASVQAPPKAPPVTSKTPVVTARTEKVLRPAPNNKMRYTLQIGSYQERETADNEVKKMKKKGYAASVVTSALPGKGTWYRVRLGSFSSRIAADKLKNDLKSKEGVSTFVTIE